MIIAGDSSFMFFFDSQGVLHAAFRGKSTTPTLNTDEINSAIHSVTGLPHRAPGGPWITVGFIVALKTIIDLVRRFEPILYFHPEEKFFPSDAKRYIEHCALWKANSSFAGARFDRKDAWGMLIDHNKIAASNAEVSPGDKFLDVPSFLIDSSTEEHFSNLLVGKTLAGRILRGSPKLARIYILTATSWITSTIQTPTLITAASGTMQSCSIPSG